MNLTGGNAITLHGNLAEGSEIKIADNTISGTGYLIYDATKKGIDLTYTGNTVADTINTTRAFMAVRSMMSPRKLPTC